MPAALQTYEEIDKLAEQKVHLLNNWSVLETDIEILPFNRDPQK